MNTSKHLEDKLEVPSPLESGLAKGLYNYLESKSYKDVKSWVDKAQENTLTLKDKMSICNYMVQNETGVAIHWLLFQSIQKEALELSEKNNTPIEN